MQAKQLAKEGKTVDKDSFERGEPSDTPYYIIDESFILYPIADETRKLMDAIKNPSDIFQTTAHYEHSYGYVGNAGPYAYVPIPDDLI